MEPFLQGTNQKIQNALAHLQRELASIRAGRANPALIEEIPVSAYGTRMKIAEVGTISAPQPTLLTVQVWDASLVKEVEKAILESELGLNPSIEGQVVRLPIPPLTEERREEFVKVASQKGEQCRIEIRQIRGEAREEWKRMEESGEIGEDEIHRREKLLQELVDQSSAEVDRLVRQKEAELRQV